MYKLRAPGPPGVKILYGVAQYFFLGGGVLILKVAPCHPFLMPRILRWLLDFGKKKLCTSSKRHEFNKIILYILVFNFFILDLATSHSRSPTHSIV